MAVIICKKCKGYYRLKEGESLEDFESCACGGELKISEFHYGFLFEEESEKPINFSRFLPKNVLKIPDFSLNSINAPEFPEINLTKSINLPQFPKIKLEEFKTVYIYYLIIFIISITTIASILYLPDFFSLLTNNEAFIAGVLTILLFFSYVYNESNRNNRFLDILLKISIFLITPLLIIFASIMINILINI